MGFLDAEGLTHFWGKVTSALAGKQNTITAGDGLSKEGDTLSAINPNRGILSQEEFDALPDEQKASGTYFVDDGGGGGTGGDSAGEVYSTDETRIGTWIDGKPLYRKVVQGNLWYPGTVIAHIDEAEYRRFDGTLADAGGIIYPIPLVTGVSSSSAFAGIQKTNNGDVVLIGNGPGAAYSVVLEYTKTTDKGGAE